MILGFGSNGLKKEVHGEITPLMQKIQELYDKNVAVYICLHTHAYNTYKVIEYKVSVSFHMI